MAPATVERTPLEGVVVITPARFDDERGWFVEAYNRDVFTEAVGRPIEFVQDNVSSSRRHTLRGIHFQVEPSAQGKLVRVSAGAVFDVAVDLRRSSDTFGRWFGIELSAANRRQVWVPVGFGHGFLAITEPAEVVYKTTAFYDPAAQRSVRWDDPVIGIEWPLRDTVPIVSSRDAAAPVLADAEVFE